MICNSEKDSGLNKMKNSTFQNGRCTVNVNGQEINITPETTLGSLIELKPSLREYLPKINIQLIMLESPLGPMIGKIASLAMIAGTINMPIVELIEKIADYMSGKAEENPMKDAGDNAVKITVDGAEIIIAPKTVLSSLIVKSPGLRSYLPKINSELALINSPIGDVLAGIATVEMLADKIDMPVKTFINKLAGYMSGKAAEGSYIFARKDGDVKVNINGKEAWIGPKTIIGALIAEKPELKDYLVSIHKDFLVLKTPLGDILGYFATVKMAADKINMPTDLLMQKIAAYLNSAANTPEPLKNYSVTVRLHGKKIVITPDTVIWALIEEKQSLRDYLPKIDERLSLIKTSLGPVMGEIATLKMIADKINMPVNEFMEKIADYMKE